MVRRCYTDDIETGEGALRTVAFGIVTGSPLMDVSSCIDGGCRASGRLAQGKKRAHRHGYGALRDLAALDLERGRRLEVS